MMTARKAENMQYGIMIFHEFYILFTCYSGQMLIIVMVLRRSYVVAFCLVMPAYAVVPQDCS